MRAWLAAVVLSAMASSMAPAYAQPPLAVPYLPQTEALCGGAAAAMVMRFWGARGVYADDFAPLVDRRAAGIHASALRSALAAQGWVALANSGDLAGLSAEVGLGHPVITLIEDRPGRFHYVVVVAAPSGGPIVVHDPARAPSRPIEAETFDRKWQRSDRWMLVLTPGPATHSTPADGETLHSPASTSPGPAASACAPTVDEAIALARHGDRAGARTVLEHATTRCPADAGPWRELAGIDALDQRWSDAAAHARRALERDPGDDLALRVLATAEYVQHHDLDALAAWNRLEEPRVDLVAIDGLSSTRYRVVADAVGVQPREVLTPDAVRLAQRRVRAIPAVSTARVGFQPLEGGLARVDTAIVERERAPTSWPSWIGLGAGAVANREVAASFTNVSGGGDAVDVSWRWWTHRPRIAASYAAPGPWGVWRLEASRETQTFGLQPIEETRSSVGGEISNWIDQRVRLGGGLAVDRWGGVGRTGGLSTRAEVWPLLDRLSLEMNAGAWRGSGASFGAASLRTRARTKSSPSGTFLLADAGYAVASQSAPASLWPGADAGHARDVLLRAHPLLDDGVIEGGVFGRRLAFGSIEGQRWLKPASHGLLRVAPAVFLDVARASRGLATTDTRTHYDAGAGLRISLLGAGVLRIDAARGLRDGAMALSVGWQR